MLIYALIIFSGISMKEKGSFSDNEDLIQRAKDGDKNAMNSLVVNNMRLVVSVIRENRWMVRDVLGFDDLLQEGAMCLPEVALKFDPDFDTSFASYASASLRNHLRSIVYNTHRTVRVTRYAEGMRRKIRRVINEHEGPLSIQDIVEASGVSEEGVWNIFTAPLEKMSLDEYVELEEESVDAVGTEEMYEMGEQWNLMQQMIKKLPEREQLIVKKWFGLEGEDECSLREIGSLMRMGKSRVGVLRQRILEQWKQQLRVESDQLFDEPPFTGA